MRRALQKREVGLGMQLRIPRPEQSRARLRSALKRPSSFGRRLLGHDASNSFKPTLVVPAAVGEVAEEPEPGAAVALNAVIVALGRAPAPPASFDPLRPHGPVDAIF